VRTASLVLAALATLTTLWAMALSSCAVHRLSAGYACSKNGDCDDGRVCDRGFCVAGQSQDPCPGICSSCNMSQRTCRIDCTANRPCGDVECPDGFECTVGCINTGACRDIDCAQGTGCDISCTGTGACGEINCGKQACKIDCTGAASCPFIDCVDSCRCDVECSGAAACPSPSCPEFPGALCTRNEEPGATCDSSVSVECDTCN
jgi:hypothetical protein